MQRHRRIIGLIAAALLALPWLAAAPFVAAGDPCYHGFEVPAATVGTGTDVQLSPCAFAPTVTSVAVGETVSFHNGPDFTHLVTGANQSWGSRDVEIQPNRTVSYTFDEPGVYPYACALHRGMSGAIVVGSTSAMLPAGVVDEGSNPAAPETAPASAPSNAPLTAALAAIAGASVAAAVVMLAMRQRRSSSEASGSRAV